MGKINLSDAEKKRLSDIEARLECLAKKVDDVASIVMAGDVNDKTFQERLDEKTGKKKNEHDTNRVTY